MSLDITVPDIPAPPRNYTAEEMATGLEAVYDEAQAHTEVCEEDGHQAELNAGLALISLLIPALRKGLVNVP